MPDSQTQLTPPFANWGTGYRPPRFFNPQLTLSPPFTLNRLGWSLLGWDLQVRSLALTLPDGGDDALCTACGALAQRLGTSRQLDPQVAAPSF